MSRSGEDWRAVYEPMLNRRLDGVWFYPLAGCDTPDVVRDLNNEVIGFSGAVGLSFEQADLYLTWAQVHRGDFELASYGEENGDWNRSSVDRIRMSAGDPWGNLLGGQLTRVTLYRTQGFDDGQVITTAAHHLRTANGEAVLWISTATGDSAGAGDDLLVSVDRDLTDPEWFQPVTTIQ